MPTRTNLPASSTSTTHPKHGTRGVVPSAPRGTTRPARTRKGGEGAIPRSGEPIEIHINTRDERGRKRKLDPKTAGAVGQLLTHAAKSIHRKFSSTKLEPANLPDRCEPSVLSPASNAPAGISTLAQVTPFQGMVLSSIGHGNRYANHIRQDLIRRHGKHRSVLAAQIERSLRRLVVLRLIQITAGGKITPIWPAQGGAR